MNYLDTSALVRAWKLKKAPAEITRAHSVAEFYSTLTGGITMAVNGVTQRIQFSPAVAAAAARDTFLKMKFQDLDGPEALEQTKLAAGKNVHGANIHDWMHGAAAKKAGCKRIVTDNERHFKLVTTLPLVEPADFF